MNPSEKERLNLNISRFDHYYDTINNKIAVNIAINTFFLGGVLGVYFAVDNKVINCKSEYDFMIGLFTFLGLITIGVLIYASIPFLNYKSSSLYYFGTIAQNTVEEYKLISKERDEKGDLKDLREQVYFLSQGLSKKFTILKWAGYSMLFQVIVLVFVAIIIFNNKI